MEGAGPPVATNAHAEGGPSAGLTHERQSLGLVQIIRNSQGQHGVKHGDFQRYRYLSKEPWQRGGLCRSGDRAT